MELGARQLEVAQAAVLSLCGRHEAALLGWRALLAVGNLPILSACGAYHAAVSCGDFADARAVREQLSLISTLPAFSRLSALEETYATGYAEHGAPNSPVDTSGLLDRARRASSAGEWRRAAALWRRLIGKNEAPEARLRLVQSLVTLGRHEEALEHAVRGLIDSPGDERILRWRARAENLMLREQDRYALNLTRFRNHDVFRALRDAAMSLPRAEADVESFGVIATCAQDVRSI